MAKENKKYKKKVSKIQHGKGIRKEGRQQMNPIFRIMKDKDVVTMGLISGLFDSLRLDWGHFRTISLAVKLM